MVTSTYIIVIRGRRACLWGSLYLDDFDEEDRDLKYATCYILYIRYSLDIHSIVLPLQTRQAALSEPGSLQSARIAVVVAQVCPHKAYMGVPSRSLVKYGRLITQHTGAGWPDLN